MDDEHLIRGVMEKRIAAMAAADAPAAMAVLAPDLVVFELAGPLRISAAQATDVAASLSTVFRRTGVLSG